MPAFPRIDWSRLHPARNPWQLAGLSVAVGILLFLLVWLFDPDDGDEAAADIARDNTRDSLSLPVPLAGGQSVSHMQQPRFPDPTTPAEPQATPQAQPGQAPPDPAAEAASPAAATPAAVVPPATGTTQASSLPTPIPEQSPAPEYPVSAMRNRIAGTVLLRVAVDAEGVPGNVEVIRRSGDRTLDRAALSAVRQWRFTPAQQDGKPVAGSVDIPISFELAK